MKVFIEIICGMALPCILFLCGSLFFARVGKYIFSIGFIKHKLCEKNEDGKSAFSSLWLALGGTLGVGNIFGVAAAIYAGGAGSVFWMWICALFSAASKYAETVLAVHYIKSDSRKNAHTGVTSYMKDAIGTNAVPTVFCFTCITSAFTMGNAIQVKSAAEFLNEASGIPKLLTGVVFAFAVFWLCIGKDKTVLRFASKAVPLLCLGYTALCICNIAVFKANIAPVTRQIIKEAFTPRAGLGGFIGYLTMPSLRLGITRGIMSNEAGCGSAPIAYAQTKNACPVRSGMLGIIEVLTDTVFFCTLTAYAILLPQTPIQSNSAATVLSAFSSVTGEIVDVLLCVAVFMFALAAVGAWSFYATQVTKELKLNKFQKTFPFLFSLTALFACFANESLLWAASDISICTMALINITAVTFLTSDVRSLTLAEYRKYKSEKKLKR